MITLDAGKYLYMTSTSGVCYATVEGMELNTSTLAETYKVLSTAGGGTSVVIPTTTTTLNYIYTVPATTSVFIKSIFVNNTSAVSTETITIMVSPNNTPAATNEIFTLQLVPNGSAFYGGDGWMIYDANGVVQQSYRGVTQIGIGGTNTAGTITPISSGTLQLQGVNNIVVSQAGNAVSISAADQALTFYDNIGTLSYSTVAIPFQSVHIFPLVAQQFFPAPMTVNSFWIDMTGNVTEAAGSVTNSAMTAVCRVGIYTVNGASLSLLNSAAKTIFQTNNTHSVSNNLSSYVLGGRYLQFTSGDWSKGSLYFNYSRYYIALNWAVTYGTNTSTNVLAANASMSMFGQFWGNTGNSAVTSPSANNRSGFCGSNSVANSTNQGFHPFWGILTATTNAFPNPIAMTDINKQVSSALFMPHIVLNNLTPAGNF